MEKSAQHLKNLLDHDFSVCRPNEKWLTDITESHLPAGKVYLSPVIDCFDGQVVSWAIETRPDAALVNTMLDDSRYDIILPEPTANEVKMLKAELEQLKNDNGELNPALLYLNKSELAVYRTFQSIRHSTKI